MNEYFTIAFTENQIGVLNRITACYLRRKINIESLNVYETPVKGISIFVISAFMSEEVATRLMKKISNIIDVIEVENHTKEEIDDNENVTLLEFSKSGGVILHSDLLKRKLMEISNRK